MRLDGTAPLVGHEPFFRFFLFDHTLRPRLDGPAPFRFPTKFLLTNRFKTEQGSWVFGNTTLRSVFKTRNGARNVPPEVHFLLRFYTTCTLNHITMSSNHAELLQQRHATIITIAMI